MKIEHLINIHVVTLCVIITMFQCLNVVAANQRQAAIMSRLDILQEFRRDKVSLASMPNARRWRYSCEFAFDGFRDYPCVMECNDHICETVNVEVIHAAQLLSVEAAKLKGEHLARWYSQSFVYLADEAMWLPVEEPK